MITAYNKSPYRYKLDGVPCYTIKGEVSDVTQGAVSIAAHCGDIESLKIFEKIIKRKCDTQSELIAAVVTNNIRVVDVLLQYDNSNINELLKEVAHIGNKKMERLLIKHGASIENQTRKLIIAIKNKSVSKIKNLLNQGEPIDSRYLHWCVHDKEILKIFVEHGADIHFEDHLMIKLAIFEKDELAFNNIMDIMK